jgi:hypothetical protein
MKRSLIALALSSALIIPAFAEDAAKPTEPVRTTTIENKLTTDTAHMQGQMNGLLRDYAIWIVVAVVVLIAIALVWFNPGVPVG